MAKLWYHDAQTEPLLRSVASAGLDWTEPVEGVIVPSAVDAGQSLPFWIAHNADGPALNGHVCFSAPFRAAVDGFHAAALAAGGRDNGKPGLRPEYHANYYAAFIIDLDGYRIEAVRHQPD